jgi:hypothetical protein
MNPTILLCLALAAFLVVSVGVVVTALAQAPDGFEDDAGFHSRRAVPGEVGKRDALERRTPEAVPLAGSAACRPPSAGKVAGDILTA